MKHKTEILIDADRETVWRFFDNPDNMTRWQPTLKSFTHISGTPGQVDAVSELVYHEGSREIVITGKITARRAPEFLGGTYESKWAAVVTVNLFEQTADGRTRWSGNTNYQFKGFMKLMALFARKSICEHIDADMQRFKLFVETELAGTGSKEHS
jgi:carbon monoxide dehydrogenase subunit G